MREELDRRVRAALQADVDQLPLTVTEAMVQERIARPMAAPVLTIAGWLPAGAVLLVLFALGLSLLMGVRNVGPPVEVPRAPSVICRANIDAQDRADCLAAVDAAIAVLPAEQAPLRATFLRGRVFTCEESCAEDIRRDATVVMEITEPGPDLFVPVTLGGEGETLALGDPSPVPGGKFDPSDPAPARATWQYVALGTGFTGSASWPAWYGDQVAEEMGVAVELRIRAAGIMGNGPTRADAALERIRTDSALRELVAEAELITIGPALEELREPMLAFAVGDPACGGRDNQDCIRAAMSDVRADWEALLDELVALRSPAEANIVAITQAAWLADWACDGWGTPCWEVLVGYWVDLHDFVAESARARGLKVADTQAALHAPGVYDAPVNPAYVSRNGMDLSDEASSVVVDVLRAVGY